MPHPRLLLRPLPRSARSPPDETWLDESTVVGDQADVFTPAS
jgi:hypothetical protein